MNGFATFSARLRSASGVGIDDNGCAHDEDAELALDIGRRDAHLEAPTLHPRILHPRRFEHPLVVAGRDHEHGEHGRADGLAEVLHLNRGSSSSLPRTAQKKGNPRQQGEAQKTLPLVDHNFRYCVAVSSCCTAAAEIFYRTAGRGRRMKTGLQDKVSSPRSPASSDNEFAASLAAQLAAQAERFHKASPISPASADDDFGKSLAAKLAERSERLRTGAFSTPPPSGRSDFSAPGIDPREEQDHSLSWLASIRVGHIWLGVLLMLFAGAAVLAVRGLPFPASEPLPPSPVEPAKAAIPRADDMSDKAPPPASAPAISPPPASPSPATSLEQPPAPSAPQTPLPAPAKPAPLSADEIRELQGKLKALGFDPGAVDGVVGPTTMSAVRKYSKARAIANAEATRDSLVRLRSEPPPKK